MATSEGNDFEYHAALAESTWNNWLGDATFPFDKWFATELPLPEIGALEADVGKEHFCEEPRGRKPYSSFSAQASLFLLRLS